MVTEGFVAIPRKVAKTKVFNEHEKFGILVKLIFKARFREGEAAGVKLNVNQFLCTKKHLADEFHMSENKLRSILVYFEKYGYIKMENIKNKYTRITISEDIISNYSAPYKDGEKSSGTRKGKAPVDSTADVININDAPELKGYGEFKNVMLTEEQYRLFSLKTSQCDRFINKLSAYLINHPKKKYESHYALLISEFEDKQLSMPGNASAVSEKPNIFNDGPSYDIQRAEQWARTHVPKVKKREVR